MQQSLFQRVAPVLEWSFIARSSIPLVGLIFMWTFHLIWAGIVIFILDGGDKVFRRDEYALHLSIVSAMILGAFIILSVGYRLAKKKKEPIWYQALSANYFGLSLVWGGYITGALSAASGIVLMGAPLFGFLILERRVVLGAFATSLLALLLFNYASAWQWIPYAPLTIAPVDQTSAAIWVLCQIMIAAPHYAFDLGLCGLVLVQWREREINVLKLSQTDSLTGLHNRRHMLTQLRRELSRAERHKTPLSLVIFDLDHFKKINDTYGHPIGDEVIKKTANVISKEIRAGDSVGRFGGEEFMLLLPRTTQQEAAQLTERYRQKLSSLHITPSNHLQENHNDDEALAIPVSASFGVAWVNNGNTSNEQTIVSAADEALYRAKLSGRNRIEFAVKPCTKTFNDAIHQEKKLASPYRVTSLLRNFNYIQLIRGFLTGMLQWSPVNKARLVVGTSVFVAINFYIWLWLSVSLSSNNDVLDLGVANLLFSVAPIVFIVPALTIWAGKIINKKWSSSRWYQIISLQIFAAVLLFIGYFLGIAYMPTGIMLVCTPVVGLLLFERTIVLTLLVSSVIAVIGLAFASVFGHLPYAPLISVSGTAWQEHSPFWVTANYLASSYTIIVVFALVDHILGRWREREAEIRELSVTDSLTRVCNRHSILAQLNDIEGHADRHGLTYSIIMLDLDNFKSINDTWGHPMGDAVLRKAADALSSCLREGDVIGRFGGEEFLLVLPNTNNADAAAIAERCRKKVEAVQLRDQKKNKVAVSASLGVATRFPSTKYSTETMIKIVDDALYLAKNNGRNRVEIATGEYGEPVFL